MTATVGCVSGLLTVEDSRRVQDERNASCSALGRSSSIPSVRSFVRAIRSSSSSGKRFTPAGTPPDARWWIESACTENERSMISIGLPSRPAMLTSAPSTSACTRRSPSTYVFTFARASTTLVSCLGERRHVDLAIVVAGVREQRRRP